MATFWLQAGPVIFDVFPTEGKAEGRCQLSSGWLCAYVFGLGLGFGDPASVF